MDTLEHQQLWSVETINHMSKLPDPRDLVLDKEVSVTSGIHGHTHRKPNRPKKQYFQLHEENHD